MKLSKAFPSLFKRPFAILERGTQVLVAGTLLDTPRRETMMVISPDDIKAQSSAKMDKLLVFFGYPLLAKLLEINRGKYYKFLYSTCERSSIHTRPISSNAELSTVLEGFMRTKFGWSLVQERGKYDVVALPDFISLYQSGILQTDLTVGEVASPEIFSLSPNTGLRKALQKMMKRRIRRVILADSENRFVSDREILTYIFTPERLRVVRDDPSKILDATLGDVGAVRALKVDERESIKKIFRMYKPESGAWCLVCSKGIVTPWDLVVKPWNMGRLRIGAMASKKVQSRRAVQ